MDWPAYAEFCDEDISCFEPEAAGQQVAMRPTRARGEPHRTHRSLGLGRRRPQTRARSADGRAPADSALTRGRGGARGSEGRPRAKIAQGWPKSRAKCRPLIGILWQKAGPSRAIRANPVRLSFGARAGGRPAVSPVLLRPGGHGPPGALRTRSHCRFVRPRIHFISELLTDSAALFLQRQCDRTLGEPRTRKPCAALP
jgi:hypothetical protein